MTRRTLFQRLVGLVTAVTNVKIAPTMVQARRSTQGRYLTGAQLAKNWEEWLESPAIKRMTWSPSPDAWGSEPIEMPIHISRNDDVLG